MKDTKNKKNLLFIGIPVIVLLILLRFGLYFLKSDGFNGLSMLLPAFMLGFMLFAFGTSGFFAAWIYQDCRKRGDDPVLWALLVFIMSPFIGMLIYFLRRSEIKGECPACGHRISTKANYCEECGTHLENKEDNMMLTKKGTHHLHLIIAGAVSMVLMLACLTGFIVKAASGNGINTDPASNDRVWNMGVIGMELSTYFGDVWHLEFKTASKGYIVEQNMKIEDADSQMLYADISCGSVPDGATLVLWLVQGEEVQSVDVTSLSEPLEYPLDEFKNGKIHVRLQINGVKDAASDICIK